MNPYDQYLESSVLTATPLELVAMLYRCALDSTAEARRCLACGDIEGRVRPVNKAFDAVTELTLSLDYEKGGELSRSLAELYGYILNQIILGHCNQSDENFAEAARLLTTMFESWQQLGANTAAQQTFTAGAAA
jgi:flagellar protein FliS